MYLFREHYIKDIHQDYRHGHFSVPCRLNSNPIQDLPVKVVKLLTFGGMLATEVISPSANGLTDPRQSLVKRLLYSELRTKAVSPFSLQSGARSGPQVFKH